MNLEKSIQNVWDLHPELDEKVPKERVTTGPPGKGVLPYVTIEIDRCLPGLLVNSGYLRETIHFHLCLRHNNYAVAREVTDLLHEIFKVRTLDDPDSTQYAQVSLSKTTIERLDDWTWLSTIGMVADVYVVEEE